MRSHHTHRDGIKKGFKSPRKSPQVTTSHHAEFVYVLIDPITREICYVGKSGNPRERYETHCYKPGMGYGRNDWLVSLIAHLDEVGRKPEMWILERLPIGEAGIRERELIERFWREGCPLGNKIRKELEWETEP